MEGKTLCLLTSQLSTELLLGDVKPGFSLVEVVHDALVKHEVHARGWDIAK